MKCPHITHFHTFRFIQKIQPIVPASRDHIASPTEKLKPTRNPSPAASDILGPPHLFAMLATKLDTSEKAAIIIPKTDGAMKKNPITLKIVENL